MSYPCSSVSGVMHGTEEEITTRHGLSLMGRVKTFNEVHVGQPGLGKVHRLGWHV
jgi:hypothetical protein